MQNTSNKCYQQKPSLLKLDQLMNLTSTVRLTRLSMFSKLVTDPVRCKNDSLSLYNLRGNKSDFNNHSFMNHYSSNRFFSTSLFSRCLNLWVNLTSFVQKDHLSSPKDAVGVSSDFIELPLQLRVRHPSNSSS